MNSPLPVRAGVSASRQYLPDGRWPSLLAFLTEFYPQVAPELWLRRLSAGEVVDQQGRPWRADSRYQPGQWLFYYREIEQEPSLPVQAQILFQDTELLVADKPHGMPVTPVGRFVQQSLLVQLKRQTGLEHLVPLHRIDRETAGLVLFSVNPASRGRYSQLFQQQQITKEYLALSQHALEPLPHCYSSRIEPGEPFYRMQQTEGPANAHSQIRLLGWDPAAQAYQYRLQPLTGKKHQLRVQMASLGAPILNDPLYPELRWQPDTDFERPLQLLAAALSFQDPLSGQPRQFHSRQRLIRTYIPNLHTINARLK